MNADDVKTVRMATVAKLIGTLDPLPLLIYAPKPLLAQWQEELLQKLHRIRRGNLPPANVYGPPEKKLLYSFAEQLAARTRTMLLATATPVQLHPMELWDLLYILSLNNPQVLGSLNGFWRKRTAR